MQRHLAAAEANLGLFQLASLADFGEPPPATALDGGGVPPQQPADVDMAAADAQPAGELADAEPSASAELMPLAEVQVRRQWLLGRIAEARRQPAAAAAAFAACHWLLLEAGGSQEAAAGTAMPAADAAAGAAVEARAAPDAAEQVVDAASDQAELTEAAPAAALAAGAALTVRLRGCMHDALVSIPALDNKLQALRLFDVLETGRARLKEGQHTQVLQVRLLLSSPRTMFFS